MTVAVQAAGRLAVARARIQAVEATGPVKPLIEPDTSQAAPTLRTGAGTRRRAGVQPLGNLAAKLAVAERPLRGG